MNRSSFSRHRARIQARLSPLVVCAFVATLSGCAVYDSSLLADMDSPLAKGGSAALAGFGGAGGGAAGAPSAGSIGQAGEAAASDDAGAAGDTSSAGGAIGASGGNASAGASATAGSNNGGSAQAGSAQGGSAGSAQGGSAGSAQAGSSSSAGAGGADAPHDLTTGKTATASTQQTGNEVVKGNDGNLSTRWCGKDDSLPQWWRVDLGASHQLSSFSVAFQIATRAYTYDIETSPDDKVYTRRLTVTGTGAVQTGDFPAGVSARYVRITVTSTESLSPGVTVWASFYEFSVLGL
jgi:F5/8 type C domain